MPTHRVRVPLGGGAFRSGNFRKFKPRMIGEQTYQALTDQAGRTENAGFKFLAVERKRTKLLAAFRIVGDRVGTGIGARVGAHARPPSSDEEVTSARGPMRVPRPAGLKVLRTHTTISVSAASGSTLACNTFAPLSASA